MDNIIDFNAVREQREKTPEQLDLQQKRLEAIKQLPQFRGEVASKNNIRSLPDVEPGQIFWVTGDHKAYLVAEKKGRKLTIKALDETATLSTGITIYEMNKSIVSKEPIFNWKDALAVATMNRRLMEWFNEEVSDQFYLLYGRDIHYVSLLQKQGALTDENIFYIYDCVNNIGDLISMDFNTSDGELSIEIWVRTADSKAELLYLFPYDKGLVTL
jgi:hypothetical protein